ncbi:hypothetical protein RJG79_03320 [Mycoplasmatota bacterium WC44]
MKRLFSLITVVVLVVSLAACGEKITENQQKLEQARTALILNDLSNVKGDLVLPEAGRNNVEITWQSSNTDVVENTGVVTRPGKSEGDVKLSLTATLTLGEDTVTKEFEARVIAASWQKYANLKAAIEAETDTPNVEVYVENLTVVATHRDGYIVTDGSASANIYKGPLYDVIQVGDVLTLGADFSFYYGQNNFSNPGFVRIQDKDSMQVMYKHMSIDEIVSFENNVIPMELSCSPVVIKGVVELVGPYKNVHISNENGSINVYYKSDSGAQDTLKGMVGREVEVFAVLYAYHTGDKVYQIVVDEAKDFFATEIDKTTEEIVELNESFIKKQLPDVSESNVTLPSVVAYGQEITWTSDDFTITDGELVAPVVAKAGVLKATYTIDSESYEVLVNVAVGPLTDMDIVTAKAEADGTLVKVTGIISGLDSYGKGVYLQANDGEAIYVSFLVMPDVEAGDEITVVGSLTLNDSYGNYVREIEGSSLNKVVSTGNTVLVEDMTIAETTSEVKDTLSRRVKLTVVVDYTDDYGYVFFTDDTHTEGAMTVKLKPSHNGIDESLLVDGETVVIEANLQKVSYDNIVLYNAIVK